MTTPDRHFAPSRMTPWSHDGDPPTKKAGRWGPPRPYAVPETARGSALRELEAATRLGAAVLLALDHAAVAGEEAALLEDSAKLRLEIGQSLRHAVAHRAGLTRKTAASHRDGDVV